ncbi:MAG: O-antigen biosynthesis protein WlbC [Chlamydiales bacterium]
MKFIDLNTQYEKYQKEIDEAIRAVLQSGNFILGPVVNDMENALAQFVGVKHCLGVSSGTDALRVALLALDIRSGDEVITTPFTWVSPAEVIAMQGAKPVFVDIEETTYNLNPDLLEQAITPRTKAIMPVSLFGQMANFEKINAIAAKYGIPVIEDGAQSFGATQNGIPSCGATYIGCTSFFPTKPLGCYGDGGAIFTNDDEIAAKMRAFSVHGQLKRHLHQHIGMNARLDTLQAAIVRAKLPHLSKELHNREKIGQRYTELLQDYCATPHVMPGNTHVYAQYTIRVQDREYVLNRLKGEGIPTAIYYPKCIHEQPAYEQFGFKRGSLPVAEKAADEVLSLPMHPWLTDEEQDKIVASIIETVGVKVG